MNGKVEKDMSGEPKSAINIPAQGLLSNINCFRVSGDYCDVTFTVEGVNFPAHKCVLAGLSPYFKALFSNGFSESNEECIKVKSVDASAMSHVLDYAYGESVEITLDNVQNLLHVSNFFQIPTFFDQCAKFLGTNLNAISCLGIYNLAKVYHCNSLVEKAKEYTLKNFVDVCKDTEFLELDTETLIDFIGSDSLNIAESDEIKVFNAVVKWLSFKEAERTPDLSKVLTQVRLAHIPTLLLYDIVETVHFVRNSPACLRLLERAVKYRLVENRRLELQSPMSKRRHLWSQVEVILICAEKLHTGSPTKKLVCFADDGRFVKECSLPAQVIESVNVTSSQLSTYFVQWQRVYLKANHGESSVTVAAHWFGITELDGWLYAFGGMNSESSVSDRVVRYSMKTSSQIAKNLSPLLIPVYSPGVVTLRGMIYDVGGLDKDRQTKNVLQRYDPRSNSWTLLNPLPSKRGEFKVCAMNDQIYACEFFAIVPPADKNENSRNVYVYAPTTDKWLSCAKLSYAFVSGPVPCNGNLFVLTERPDKERILEKYDPVSDTWGKFASFVSYRPFLLGGTLLTASPSPGGTLLTASPSPGGTLLTASPSPNHDPEVPLNFIRVLK